MKNIKCLICVLSGFLLILLIWRWMQTNQLQVRQNKSTRIEDLVGKCLKATNMDSPYMTSQAKINARYIYQELQKVIPANSLRDYKSHCWKETYSVEWNKKNLVTSHMGNISFSERVTDYPLSNVIYEHKRKFGNIGTYNSNVVCLPNVFLAGFYKCGSTYFSDVLNNMLSTERLQYVKEIHFWVRHRLDQEHTYSPTPDNLGVYFLNYVPGMKQILEFDLKNTTLIDGTPSIMNYWPIFNLTEKMVNYCLLPSVIPNILPKSKFIVVMRNPLHMLYSLFWFDCTNIHKESSNKTILRARGPDIFHDRMMSKLRLFNECMKDVSVPSLRNPCVMESKDEYHDCIKQRIHFLDKCTLGVILDNSYEDKPKCGAIWLRTAIYFTHVRKWLSVVPRDRFLFVKLEDFLQHPSENMHDIYDFLGHDFSTADDEEKLKHSMEASRQNKQKNFPYTRDPKLYMKNETKAILEIFFHPFNSFLAELLKDERFKWT